MICSYVQGPKSDRKVQSNLQIRAPWGNLSGKVAGQENELGTYATYSHWCLLNSMEAERSCTSNVYELLQ